MSSHSTTSSINSNSLVLLRGVVERLLVVESYNKTDGNDNNDSNNNSTSDNSDFLDKLGDGTDKVKEEVNSVLTNNPNAWTTAQKMGVAIGSVVAVLLFACVLVCCVQCYRRRKEEQEEQQAVTTNIVTYISPSANNKTTTTMTKTTKKTVRQPRPKRSQPRSNNTTATSTIGDDTTDPIKCYRMKKPYVVRGTAPSSAMPHDAIIDAMNPSTLPLGVKLHGVHKLRHDGLLGQGVKIAVIDSGIDKGHPGFHQKVARQVWYRKDTPLIEDDHGTHVAGTIHFMAPQALLYDYRVFGKSGSMDGDAAVAAAIREAVDKDKCHIINMSLRVSYPLVPQVQQAVEHAYRKGVHMVCAAGNSGDGDPTTNELYAYPARFPQTISVAAVQKVGSLPVAYFSESNPQVDFAGIGVDVVSLKPGGGVQSMQGTSMAAPHVTGLIAALLSNGKKYSDKKLRKLLALKYAIDIGVKGPDTSTGVGFATYLTNKSELEHLLASSAVSSSSNTAGKQRKLPKRTSSNKDKKSKRKVTSNNNHNNNNNSNSNNNINRQ